MPFRGPPILQLLFRRRGGRARPSCRSTSAIAATAGGADARGGRPGAGRRERGRGAARAAGGAALPAPARAAHARRAGRRAARRWSPPASRSGCSSARSTASTRRPPPSRWRARWPPRAGVRCVPLFWLQTEDHDFAEIASATVADRRRRRRCGSRSADAGRPARASVAHRRLGRRGRRRSSIASPRRWARRPRRRRDAWPCCAPTTAAGRPLAAAFAGALAALFADDGLLVFDPREARVARAGRAGLPAGASRGARAIEAALTGARRGAGRGRVRRRRSAVRPGCALLLLPPRRPRTARASGCSATADGGRLAAVGRATRPSPTSRARRGARARAAAVLDVGAAAADRPGHPAADRRLRRRPRPSSTTSPSSPPVYDALRAAAAAGGSAGPLPLSRRAHAPAARRRWASTPTTSGARAASCSARLARRTRADASRSPDPAGARAQVAGQIAAADRPSRAPEQAAPSLARGGPDARPASPARSSACRALRRATSPSATA